MGIRCISLRLFKYSKKQLIRVTHPNLKIPGIMSTNI